MGTTKHQHLRLVANTAATAATEPDDEDDGWAATEQDGLVVVARRDGDRITVAKVGDGIVHARIFRVIRGGLDSREGTIDFGDPIDPDDDDGGDDASALVPALRLLRAA